MIQNFQIELKARLCLALSDSPTLYKSTARVRFGNSQKQFRLLHDENIHTVPELEAFIGKLSKQLDDLDAERKKIDNKRRRAKTDDETKAYYAQIRGISTQI